MELLKICKIQNNKLRQQGRIVGKITGQNHKMEPQEPQDKLELRGAIGMNDKTNYRIDLQKEL